MLERAPSHESQPTWEPLSLRHADVIHAAIKGNVAEYFYNFKTIEETRDWVLDAIEKQKDGAKREFVLFDQGRFIGMISPCTIAPGVSEIGMWIATEEQGKGYGKRALGKPIELLEQEGVNEVVYETEKTNQPSMDLAASFGFVPEDRGDMVRFTKRFGSDIDSDKKNQKY